MLKEDGAGFRGMETAGRELNAWESNFSSCSSSSMIGPLGCP